MKTRRLYRLTYLCVSAALVGLPFFGSTAVAAPIDPGFDYFLTPPGGASIDLGPTMGGVVPLEGVPLPYFRLSLTDTVVARMDPGPPEGGTGIIDIELVALHLKSVAPVPTPGGPADLHVTIDSSDRFFSNAPPAGGMTIQPDGTGTGPSLFNLPTVPNPPSTGLMELMHDPPGPIPPHTGADMRACFGAGDCAATAFGAGLGVPGGGIYASLFFVVPGGDPSNPLDVIVAMPAPRVIMSSLGRYVHTTFEPEEYGGAAILSALHDGPHPHAQPVRDDIIPEPSSALLALCAVLGCGLVRSCRRRKLSVR